MKTGCGARSDMIYDNQNSISQLKMSSPILSLLLCLLLPSLLLAKTCCDEPQVRLLPLDYEDVIVVAIADFGSRFLPLSAIGIWNYVFCSFKRLYHFHFPFKFNVIYINCS